MQYDKPGFGGNAVFAAHVDYFPDILGPFNRLKDVNEHDEIDITMDNGLVYRYDVFSKNVYSIDDLDMAELIWPTTKPAGDEWITLITCGGQFVPTESSGAGEYLSRVVVIARRIE
jgi:sortase (surface protein transpeptidase)